MGLKKVTETKGTMTDISMMEKSERPAELKPSGAPKRRDFAFLDKQRQADLGDQDTKLARRIWREFVEPIEEDFITTVFNQFFTKHPNLTDLFLRMESVGLQRLSLPKDMHFKNHHLSRIMVRLKDIMENVDQPRRLTKLMTRMGVMHAKMGLDTEESVLEDFQEAMVSTIKVAMGGKMHLAEEIAIRKCLVLAFSIMQEASFTYYDLFVASPASPKGKGKRV